MINEVPVNGGNNIRPVILIITLVDTVMVKTLLIGALYAFASIAQAVVLFDNGPFSGSQTNVRNTASNPSASPQRIYEDFTLTQDFIIAGIEWMQHDHRNLTYASTEVRIYSGLPEISPLDFSENLVAERNLNTTPVFFENWIGYDYALLSLNIELTAGTYWLGLNTNSTNTIFGDTSWDETSGVLATIPGRRVVNSLLPAPGRLVEDQDSVFRLLGEEVTAPEPTTLILVSLGLAGLGFTRRKMKVSNFI